MVAYGLIFGSDSTSHLIECVAEHVHNCLPVIDAFADVVDSLVDQVFAVIEILVDRLLRLVDVVVDIFYLVFQLRLLFVVLRSRPLVLKLLLFLLQRLEFLLLLLQTSACSSRPYYT